MVVIVCFQSKGIVCSKSNGREGRIEWTYLPQDIALQWRFFFRLTRKPDNNFTLWPGFMPISHTIIPSNRLWAPKLSKHFCVLQFAMQTCWPMSKLIEGGRSRAEGGILPLVAFQANFSRAANVSCLGFKRNLHNVDLNYTGNNSQLYTYSTFPPSLNVATKLHFQWANVSFDTLTTDIVIIPFVPFLAFITLVELFASFMGNTL